MHRDQVAMGVSTAALGAAMVAWFDLFAFSKVVYVPDWASFLPTPPFAGAIVAMPLLIPVALFSHSLRATCTGVLFAAALAPVPALVVYALAPLHQHSGLPLNLLVQYVLLAVLGCLLPGLVMLGLRVVLNRPSRTG
jgi:hypothetical protein